MSAVLDIRDDQNRVGTPVEYDAPIAPPRRTPFLELSEQAQRTTIRDHIRMEPVDDSLFGEAINDHELKQQIRAAFYAGDGDQAYRLFDRAIREYLGAEIQRGWDKR